MGNVATTALPAHPRKPFERQRRRSLYRWTQWVTRHTKARTKLQKLILLQDWQRVLIRVNLYPSELREYMIITMSNNARLRVLPLHLVCALHPPVEVVDLFLQHFVEASGMPIRPIPNRKARSNKIGFFCPRGLPRLLLHRRLREWRCRRVGAFPIELEDHHPDEEEKQILLLPRLQSSCDEMATLYLSADRNREQEQLTSTDDDGPESGRQLSHGSSSSLSSSYGPSSNNNEKDNGDRSGGAGDGSVILQLISSSGSGEYEAVTLLPSSLGGTTDSTSDSPSPHKTVSAAGSLFRVQWDLQPLLQHVLREEGSLLTLHVACLYMASESVIQSLIKAHPQAVLNDVLGMMPIHFAAAGWTLPPLVQLPLQHPPSAADASSCSRWTPPLPNEQRRPGPLAILQVLRRACPESVRIRSGLHGFTPADYIQECMEEGQYQNECLDVLVQTGKQGDGNDGADDADEMASTSTSNGSLVFADSDEADGCSSSYPFDQRSHTTATTEHPELLIACISALITARDWESVLTLVEDDPSLASHWIYGMDDTAAPQAHCTSSAITGYGAAVSETASTLAYLAPPCPFLVWRRLPIHLACMYGAPAGLIAVLLRSYPAGAATPVHDGPAPTQGGRPHNRHSRSTGGALPLHLACGHAMTLPIIQILLQYCPGASKAIEPVHGQLPIHWAVLGHAAFTVVEALIQHDPDSANIADKHGKTPIDYAIEVYGSNHIIAGLLLSIHLFMSKD